MRSSKISNSMLRSARYACAALSLTKASPSLRRSLPSFSSLGESAFGSTKDRRLARGLTISRDTVKPIADKRNIQIQVYDPRDQKALAAKILASPNKRILVSGHSNTVPALANLLGRKELFKNLDDAEYGAIWVIRIKKGEVQKIEILNY